MANPTYWVAQHVDDGGWDDLGPRLWDVIPKSEPYIWDRLTKTAEERLVDLIPNFVPMPERLSSLDRNYELRRQIAPALVTAGSAKMAPLARWIIAEWGGIRGGSKVPGRDPIPKWTSALTGFSAHAVDVFIDGQKNERISSWSKVLAFARPDDEAIYDARIAVALNVGLRALDSSQRFHMPVGRNGPVARAAAVLTGRAQSMGYRDYRAFLRSVRTARGVSLLEAETTIFANAPKLCGDFMRRIEDQTTQAAQRACRLDVEGR